MIGGTGTISSAITRQLAESGHELWLLNRGTRKQEVPGNVKQVIADIDDTESVLAGLGDAQFDAVCEFIGFVPSQDSRPQLASMWVFVAVSTTSSLTPNCKWKTSSSTSGVTRSLRRKNRQRRCYTH